MSAPAVKDRALIATLAANVVAGLSGIKDVFFIGRTLDEPRLASTAVRLARMILAEVDAPAVEPAKPATVAPAAPAAPSPRVVPAGADSVPEENKPDPKRHSGLGLRPEAIK